jgi:ubiquinone biosynthesis O-methyltransferase
MGTPSPEDRAPEDRAAARRVTVALLYGAVCHLLFAAGVATMIAAMAFGMSRSAGPLAPPWSWVANALLLLQFPLAHTFLLSPRGFGVLRRLAPRAVAADLASTTYAAIAGAQVLLLFGLWSPSGTIWWEARGGWLVLLLGLYAASWLLLQKAILDAGIALQTGFLGWWAVARGVKPAYPPMPRRGLFRLVRQPIYVAFALTLWTVPVWTPDQLAVALVLTLYCLVGPLFKEARFRRRFGAAFDLWARDVPYWLPWPRRAPAVRKDPAVRNDLSIYDRFADVWWEGSPRWLRTLRAMVPARLAHFDPIAGDWRGRRVLDLGCGGGFMAEALARRGALVVGVDPSAPAIAVARRHAAAAGLAIDYRVGTGEAIPLADGAVDIVVCVDVLEHVEDLARVVGEVARVLAPGGLFLFDTIDRTALASFVMVTLGEGVLRLVPRGTHDPARFVRPAELGGLLAAAGLAAGPCRGFGPRGVDRRLDLVFGPWPSTAVQYLGSARKPAAGHPSNFDR